MDDDFDDIPLSHSNVTLRLADIQKRCSELLESSDDDLGLSLEDEVAAEPADDGSNPYDLG